MFAIAISGVFVLLSQWQFGRSTQAEAPVSTTTEDTRQLTSVLQPGGFFPGSVADQIVSATGSYDPQKQVLVPGRLNDGAKGYWIVSAFAVKDAPVLKGAGATPQTWIPVARGWVADPADAVAPPSGTIELTGRLLPSESPLPHTDPGPGRASAVSVAELINDWNVSSYPGFVAARTELSGGTDVGASATSSAVKPLLIGPQPPAQQVNWLNLFYSGGMGGLRRLRTVHLVAAREGRLPPRPRRRARRRTGGGTVRPGPRHLRGPAASAPGRAPCSPTARSRTARQPNRIPQIPIPQPPSHRPESAIMIEPQPAIQPQSTNGTGKAGKKRRFGGTEAQIRSALKFYKVLAYLTGSMLLLLCAELIARYGFGQYLYAGGTDAVTGQPFGLGFADAEPPGVIGGVNLSVTVLIVHGWMYVVYLISNFRLWSLMRWPFTKLVVMALGGVVPFLSFFVEKKFHAEVEAELAANPQAPQRY